MEERGRGYICALRGCLGWGQDPDSEKTRDGFGFFGSRYRNTPFDGRLRPFVDPEHRDPPEQPPSMALWGGRELDHARVRRGRDGLILPSRRGGPNERYLSQADGQYHYYEDEGFWDSHGDYHFLRELGYFDDEGRFHIFNDQAELFGLGCFMADGSFYFYEEEIDRVDLNRLLQNVQGGREGSEEHGEEQNSRAGANSARYGEESACPDITRDEENGHANIRDEEETNSGDEYRDGEENSGTEDNSDGDDQNNLLEMDLEISDEGEEEEVRLPYIFPVIYETLGPDKFDEEEDEEKEQQHYTPPRSNDTDPLHSPASVRSAPPHQIHVLCNNLDSVSLKANTTPPKHSRDIRVGPSSGRINGYSPSMVSPDCQDPKHNMMEEKSNTGGPVASPGRAGRPTVSSFLKRSGSSPHNFGNLGSVGASLQHTPERRTGKPETSRASPSSHVSSVGERNPSLGCLPARYRARNTGDPFVDKVVTEEMVDWAQEEQQEAKAKKKNKKGMAKPRHP